ncbi:hypothetical protein COV06_01830 [Candidatus Uhrbacteria bacterium CG10_big_fil_rev_8_21_14_0_10_50_16]|uniref:Uncharacterized protein n=1 Tax=Candidatus Uhrbacteria bacterium CG10_big_fil_rev_8_21_14_0_10_50_16 TaxID=1975039 RepID=A0A2H0RPM4_9BACT|nr:MAG: hypothetical protein COV06_01830 [Candidatus Uhrbacteria bacterium CG10_big_fil_rev_8_21_14_0_10_50_16]
MQSQGQGEGQQGDGQNSEASPNRAGVTMGRGPRVSNGDEIDGLLGADPHAWRAAVGVTRDVQARADCMR